MREPFLGGWGTGEPLSLADAAWLRLDRRTNPMCITALLRLGGPVALADLRALVAERLAVHPRFHARVVEPPANVGPPRFVADPAFDVRAHVVRAGLPAPGGAAELREAVSDLLGAPLSRDRPLWEMRLLEGVDGGAAILARLHHCLGDGTALVRLLLSLADAAASDPAHGDEPAREPTAGEASAGRAERPAPPRERGLLAGARSAVEAGKSLAKLLLLPGDAASPLRGPLGIVKRAAWTRGFPLARLSAAAHALGVTVNDLILAALAGALRRLLAAAGATPEIRALCPVDLRGPEASRELGNRFGVVFVDLPTDEPDRARRLDLVRRRMGAIKASPEAAVAFAILGGLGILTPGLRDAATALFSRKASLIVTNVPGPRRRLSLAGAPVDGLLFWVPQSGSIGVGVSILSYAGEVVVGLSADARRVPAPELVAAHLEEEIEALVGGATAPSGAHPGAT